MLSASHAKASAAGQAGTHQIVASSGYSRASGAASKISFNAGESCCSTANWAQQQQRLMHDTAKAGEGKEYSEECLSPL
jgi:hypothetical protein